MKRLSLLLLLGLFSSSAHAGAIGAYGGKLSTEDFGDATTFGVKLEASLFEILGLELRGGYATDFGGDGLPLDDFNLISAEAGLLLRLPLGEFFSLHAGAGGGYHVMPEFDMVLPDGTVFTSDIGDAPGAYGLAGLELGTVNFRLFAEAKYLLLRPETVEADTLGGQYIEIDTDLSGPAFQAGLLIRW